MLGMFLDWNFMLFRMNKSPDPALVELAFESVIFGDFRYSNGPFEPSNLAKRCVPGYVRHVSGVEFYALLDEQKSRYGARPTRLRIGDFFCRFLAKTDLLPLVCV